MLLVVEQLWHLMGDFSIFDCVRKLIRCFQTSKMQEKCGSDTVKIRVRSWFYSGSYLSNKTARFARSYNIIEHETVKCQAVRI